MIKLIKVLSRISLFLFAIGIIHISILANPQRIFNYHLPFGNYNIYADIHISPELIQAVIDADKRIRVSELYDSAFTANIFLCNNPELYNTFTFFAGVNKNSSGLNISLFNNSFINLQRVSLLKNFHDLRITNSHLSGDLSQILAHELTHNLVANHLGFFKTKNLPRWKSEGYSEYISTISSIKH